LAPGDVIASLNGIPIGSMLELRGAIYQLTDGKPVVVEIERNGLFLYVERELEEPPFEPEMDRGAKGDLKAPPDRARR